MAAGSDGPKPSEPALPDATLSTVELSTIGLISPTDHSPLHLILREALWRFIQKQVEDRETHYEALARIGSALSLATLAAMRGYHRRYFEKRGGWPDAINRVKDATPERPPPAA